MTSRFFPRAQPSDIKVFFSYARWSDDRGRFEHAAHIQRQTEAVYSELERTPGISVFRDVANMPGGRGIDESISGAISECDVGVVIWSNWSILSDHVKDEADELKKGGKYFGVNVEPPPGYELPHGLRRVHVLDLSVWDRTPDAPLWARFVSDLLGLAGSDLPAVTAEAARSGAEVFKEGVHFPELQSFAFKGVHVLGANDSARLHEGPKIEVTFGHLFGLGVRPVSVGEWRGALRAGAPLRDLDLAGRSDTDPVVNVSWIDVQSYLSWLNYRIGADLYRLPSESQWEAAVRASVGEGASSNAGRIPAGVIEQPTGIVWNWTACTYYPTRDRNERDGSPYVQPGNFYKVIRGGSTMCLDADRSYTARSGVHERYAAPDIGFRVLRLMPSRAPAP